jgi:hypothetical protein
MLSSKRDRLTGGSLPGLAAEAERVLRVEGVPREVALDEWSGPTIFSSELSSGRLSLLAHRWPTLASHEHRNSIVLGRIREQDWDLEHAAYVLQPDVGTVIAVDLDGRLSRFVNSDLGSFLRCLEAFVTWWDDLARKQQLHASPASEDEGGERDVQMLATRLKQIDPTSLADANAYWPAWIDDLRTL